MGGEPGRQLPPEAELDAKTRYGRGVRERFADLSDSGLGRKAIASVLGVPLYTVRDWQREYATRGREAFLAFDTHRMKYPYEVRVAAATAVASGRLTRAEAMREYGIAHSATLTRWMKLYHEGGEAALVVRRRGRPPKAR